MPLKVTDNQQKSAVIGPISYHAATGEDCSCEDEPPPMLETCLVGRRRGGVIRPWPVGRPVGIGDALVCGLLRLGAGCVVAFVLGRHVSRVFDPERTTRVSGSSGSKTPRETPIRTGCEHSVATPQALGYLRPCHLLFRSRSCVSDPSTLDSAELLTRGPAVRRHRSAQAKRTASFACRLSSASMFLGSTLLFFVLSINI
jgi:hypothetical protein